MQIVMKEWQFLDSFKSKNIWTFEEIMGKVEELETRLHILEEEKEKREKNIEENYRQITPSEQYEIPERGEI